MRKLTLRLETLKVESFEAAADVEPRGTVNAHGIPYADKLIGSGACASRFCTAYETCPHTCYPKETCEPGVCW